MHIITTLSAIGIDLDEPTDDIMEDVKDALEKTFNGYVLEHSDIQDPIWTEAENMTVIFGRECPAVLTKKIQDWNRSIRKAWWTSLWKIIGTGHVSFAYGDDVPEFETDTTDTYELLLNTHMIDNSWYPFASHSYIDENGDFHHLLPDHIMKNGLSHPEEWIYAEICVKL